MSDTSNDPTDLSAVTPELAEILKKWEAANSRMDTAKIEFSRTIYNLIFMNAKYDRTLCCTFQSHKKNRY